MKKVIILAALAVFTYTIVRVWVDVARCTLPDWPDEDEYVGI